MSSRATLPFCFSSNSLCLERVTEDVHWLPSLWNDKTPLLPVEGRGGPVFGTMVVRADEHQFA